MRTRLYINGNSLLHRLDPRTKMAIIVFAIITAFLFFNPLAPLVVVVMMLVTLLLSVGSELFKSVLVRVLPIIIVTLIVIHTFVNPLGKTPIEIGEVVIRIPYFNEATWEGAYIGIVYSLRITAVFLSSLCLVLTTIPEDLVSSISKLGIPFKYASMFGMSLNMIPVLQEEAGIIIQAQRARALRESNLLEKVQSLVPLFVPLAVGAMQQAEMTGMVLEARGFGAPVKRTELHPIVFAWLDRVLMVLFVMVFVALLVYRIREGDVNWINTVRSVPDLFWPLKSI